MEFLDPMVQNLDFGYVHSFLIISYAYAGKTIIIYAKLRTVLHYDLCKGPEVHKNKK